MKKTPPPGDVLRDLLDEYQLNPTQLAEDIQMSVSAIRQIVSNKAKISLHIAKRLSKYFNTTVEYWVDLQNKFDMQKMEQDTELADILKQIPRAKKPTAKVAAAGKAPAKRGAGRPPASEKKAAEKKPRKPRAKKVKDVDPQENDSWD
ncbi:MAG: HigA family addiction module antidote protein [Spirochaetaceae bacterium]|jgi:addiction module HigA family antidote|nr:HigA family addiction module antidote protein [Spirochaetaceae bacterium]